MNLPLSLLASLVIAVVVATLCSVLLTGGLFEPGLLLAFCVATVCTALVTGSNRDTLAKSSTASMDVERSQPWSKDRSYGTVKWFNVSKGFGFIIRDSGEEVFVHFRSIRSKNRRGLRDGQRVSFLVTDSAKGPQAEDVVAEA